MDNVIGKGKRRVARHRPHVHVPRTRAPRAPINSMPVAFLIVACASATVFAVAAILLGLAW
jgi:hypothetical protein